MGNRPSEYCGEKCGVCDKALPPCTSWNDIKLKTIDRTVDKVQAYEFLHGKYYRIKGKKFYYCPVDFNGQKQDHFRHKEERVRQEEKDKYQIEAQLGEASISTYMPLSADDIEMSNNHASYELLSEHVDLTSTPVMSEEVSEKLLSSIALSLSQLNIDDKELDNDWLRSAQTIILIRYLQVNKFSEFDSKILLDFLAYLQLDLNSKDCLTLAKTMIDLKDTLPLDFKKSFDFTLNLLPLVGIVSYNILFHGRKFFRERNVWVQKCLYMFISSQTCDQKIPKQFLQITNECWTIDNWLELFQIFVSSTVPADIQKQVLHLIQTYCLNKPTSVISIVKGSLTNIIPSLTDHIKNEENKELSDLFDELRDSKLLDSEFIKKVMKIANSVYDNFDINLDYENELQTSMSIMKQTFMSLKTKHAGMMDCNLTASSIITLMCAVRKVKPWYPRKTQVISLIILILTGWEHTNRLLEVQAGEGKSCLVALYAAVLCMQNKVVDVVTSFPALALRDVAEWEEFYRIFGFTVTHNTDLERDDDDHIDDVKKDCYQHNIVYGTLGNFCADILREEFQHKKVRCRPFDAIIVDEVNMLMPNEGVQFTYLSHNAAMLNHMNSVLAYVWSLIGPLRMTLTTGYEVLYAGTPKPLPEAISECLDPETQVLDIAKDAGIITDNLYQRLNGGEQETKQKAFDELTQQNSLDILSKLNNCQGKSKFFAFISCGDNLIEAKTKDSGFKDANKFLLLNSGLACPLNTHDEVVERATKILKSKLKSSDNTEEKGPVKFPLCLKGYVMAQVSVYVESAIRALHMEEDRQYAISEGKIIPVDFQNSSVVEMNKKWGGGLQQMLEMKHCLRISPISLQTNFMSNFEYFTRYSDGGIYGISGTIGLDSGSNTRKILNELYKISVCSIPTFKARKLVEKPAIIVENKEKWYKQIVNIVNEERQNVAPWKTGRAALILCEDIKSAKDMREYVIKKEGWAEDKIYLHAHSNSKQLLAIKKTLSKGEVVIATNLAGRGTNIEVVDSVNKSGGLLCLVTFIASSRQMELQALGCTAQSGKPGSVCCILDASTMPSIYTGLDIQGIRKVREQVENIQLNSLTNNNMKKVKLKEKLLKNYCKHLSNIHCEFERRDDLDVVINSTNENWGMWLETKVNEIEEFKEETLLRDMNQWFPTDLSASTQIVHPFFNFYHLIQFGNQLMLSKDYKEIQTAAKYYTESIKQESSYGLIAYYNRAYCNITSESRDYKTSALADLEVAVLSIDNFMDELLLVKNYTDMVKQTKGAPQRKNDGFSGEVDPQDLVAQIHARFDIYSFLKKNINDAIDAIKKLDGANYIAKPVGLFSLIPDANYITKLELTSLWSLGLEIVYTIEKKFEFHCGALAVFLLGVVQIIGGFLWTAFGTETNIELALIAGGVSDCISGIEGMFTNEFNLVEWGINKATKLAQPLSSGRLSPFATTDFFKAIKNTYISATTAFKQLKALSTVGKSSIGVAARANLKNAAKYVAKVAALQGIDYAQNKLFNAAMMHVYSKIGEKLSLRIAAQIRAAFSEGYFGDVIDQRYYTQWLDPSYSSTRKVPESLQSTAEIFFNGLNDATFISLSNDSDVKATLTSASLSLFQHILHNNYSNHWVSFFANLAEVTVVGSVVNDTVTNLQLVVDKFIPKMKEMCQEANTADNITAFSSEGAASCVLIFKSDLAEFVIGRFSKSIAALMQGKLNSMVSHVMNRTLGRMIPGVVDKFKINDTLEKIIAGQHANYIRSVRPSETNFEPVSEELLSSYVNHVQNSNSAGSLLDLRIASEHFGKKVIIYQERNGKLVKDSLMEPKKAITEDTIELLYTAPLGDNSVGHYDVIREGNRIRVQADNSNCLFHAFALGLNPNLSENDLRAQAGDIREKVAQDILHQHDNWGEHIKRRVEMDNLQMGTSFALIGAGPKNPKTKVLKDFYKEEAVGAKVYTMYRQDNGILAKGIKEYDRDLNGRLQSIKIRMDNLNLDKNKGKRCWATNPVCGMIDRHEGDRRDTEISFHLVPSRAGANAGEKYANAVMTSSHYNNLEKKIWTREVYNAIGKFDFSMTVEGKCGRVNQDYGGTQECDDATKDKLKKRFEKVEEISPRAYRMEEIKFTIFLPSATTQTQLDGIKTSFTDPTVKCETNFPKKEVIFTLGVDHELFVPSNITKLITDGELHDDDLKDAGLKVKKTDIGKPPKYRKEPTVSEDKYTDSHDAFLDEWKEFLGNGF